MSKGESRNNSYDAYLKRNIDQGKRGLWTSMYSNREKRDGIRREKVKKLAKGRKE